ncbi:sulfotransferase [Flavobacterium sp.]|uniref:sulfotransferase family protein n=1 Tax=Flavobacterium sp. TaxID=239 RepID=UPI0025C71D1B|nr:sulfotransferase [Flavobacterium sp.]
MQNSSKCLIIVGMHRSGTSFTASLLQKAGLNIGENLLRASLGNELGHFENEDFLVFHKKNLAHHNLNPDGWSLNTVQSLDGTQKEELTSIIKKNESSQWGWKDPRTTLFLNVYKELLPNAFFLFVYRKPWEVVDSLFRRSTDDDFYTQPTSAPDNWHFYNQLILDFFKQNADRSILVDIENVMQQSNTVIELLNTKFGFNFHASPDSTFDSAKFNNNRNKNRRQQFFYENAFPDSIQLYKTLQENSDMPPLEDYISSNENINCLIDWWRDAAEIQETRNELNSKGIPFTKLPSTLTENELLKAEIDWIINSKWWKIRGWLKK